MSKSKRRIQQRRRAANVHRYTVQRGLAVCPFGGCPTCKPESERGAA